MMTSLIPGESGALSASLAGVLGRLRGRSDGRPPGAPEEDIHREADGFVDRLAGHFRHSEETIFPALRTAGSRSASEIEELEKDHRLLGRYACELAARIRSQDRAMAYGLARSFLAVLLDHIRRENSDRIEGD
jgi:iron-sulfur cluster repair protein YtfE (RIC family)